jgi:hypothetical protein
LNKPVVISRILDEFRNKAGCWRTEHKADRLLAQLKELIDDKDYWKLVVGYSHFHIGEGSEELYDVCKELSAKYGL